MTRPTAVAAPPPAAGRTRACDEDRPDHVGHVGRPDHVDRLDRLYARYRATLLHASACVLAGHGRLEAHREASRLEAAARAAAHDGGALAGQLELGLAACTRLVAWIATDLGDVATAADLEAVRRSHLAFRAAVWEVTGHCEYAPCGTAHQPARRA